MPDLKDIQQEVDEMARALGDSLDSSTNAPATDAPNTSSPSTDAPSTDAPSTDAPATSAPSTDAPATGAPTTEAPAEDEKDKIIRELREKLAEKEAAPKTKAPKTEVPQTEAPISDEDFLDGVDLDDLTRDPAEFNKLLNKIYKRALEQARNEVKRHSETVVRAIPDIVKNNIAITARLKQVHDKFYEDNKDLVPWKKVVGTIFEEFIAENPDRTYEELLPKVAEEARKRLELHKRAQTNSNEPPPKLPRKKGGPRQTTKPNTDPLLDELSEMDKALELD